jgi:hypothetical protein
MNATATVTPNAPGVRCQNPRCKAKVAEALNGTMVVTCRKCGTVQTIRREAKAA